MLRRLLLMILVAWYVLVADHVVAQDRSLGALRPRNVAMLYLASEFVTAQAPARAESATLKTTRAISRSRRLIAFGAGMVAGGVNGLMIVGPARYCSYHEYHLDRTVPRVLGGTITAVGVGLLALGVTRLVRAPREERAQVPVPRGRKFGLAGMALGATVLGTFVTMIGALPEEVGCWNT